MSAAHSHEPPSGAKLRAAFLLSFVSLFIELAGGIVSHSLALLSDAGHVLTDVVALGLAWFANIQASRPADARKTFGYHRTGILIALVNAVTLILIVGWIAFEAIQRVKEPPPVSPTFMILSAAVGIVLNVYIGLGLREGSKNDVSIRAAMLHVFGDVAASVGVIIAGLIIVLTRWSLADPFISFLIALLIAKGAWDLLREATDILMESAPRDLDLAKLACDVSQVAGVQNVHDLHVWTISGGMTALSAHLLISDNPRLNECDALLTAINELLEKNYRITHSTIQVECADCVRSTSTVYCSIPRSDGRSHEHGEFRGHGGVKHTTRIAMDAR